MATKYKLPIVDKLREIGFPFKFDSISEFFKNTEKFVKEHDNQLFPILIKGFNTKSYLNHLEDDECNDTEITDIDKRVSRISNGFIEKDDYLFVVHPVHKSRPEVIITAWQRRKIRYAIDKQTFLHYPKAFNVSPVNAIHTVLLNELYRMLILHLPQNSFPKLPHDKDLFQQYYADLNYIEYQYSTSNNPNSLLPYVFRNERERLLNNLYQDVFEQKRTVLDRASVYYHKIQRWESIYLPLPKQSTSIEDKEMVLRQYLKKQSKKVQKSRNTRGKGIHKANRQKIINYFKANRNSTISAAARKLNMDRKTIRKHKP